MISLKFAPVAGPDPLFTTLMVYSIVSPGEPPGGAVSVTIAAALVDASCATGLLVCVGTGGIGPPGPSWSITATFSIDDVTPGLTVTLNCTTAAAPGAITPGAAAGLLISRGFVNGMTGPARSATAAPLSVVLPGT